MQIDKGRAMITGASSGIGSIYADRLARRGYDLILVARDAARLTALAERLTEETGREIEVMCADLTCRDDLSGVEARLRSDKRISLLLNNAGSGSLRSLLSSDPDQLEAMIQLNVTALTRLTHAVAPGLVERGDGVIINLASSVAIYPMLLNGTYCGTKAFVLSFTQALHQELNGKGVQVQAVLPGATDTPFWSGAEFDISLFPKHFVMSCDELVDAALSGLDQHELVTIPSLPNPAEWEKIEALRLQIAAKISRNHPADRYKTPAAHAELV